MPSPAPPLRVRILACLLILICSWFLVLPFTSAGAPQHIRPLGRPALAPTHAVLFVQDHDGQGFTLGVTRWDCGDPYPLTDLADTLLGPGDWAGWLPDVQAHERDHRRVAQRYGCARTAAILATPGGHAAYEASAFCRQAVAGWAGGRYATLDQGIGYLATWLAEYPEARVDSAAAHRLIARACGAR